MVEVPFDGFAHHRFETAAAQRGVAALAEIRKIRHQQHPHLVGVIKQERIVHFDMDAQKVEAGFFRGGDVILQSGHVARGINAIRIIGLIQRAAQITRHAVQAQQHGRFRRLAGAKSILRMPK